MLFRSNTRLQTVDGRSDLVLEGEITQYYLTPQAVTEDAYASRTRLTIGVRIKYTDNKAENKDIDQSFTAYRDFDSSQMLTDVQVESVNCPCLKKMSVPFVKYRPIPIFSILRIMPTSISICFRELSKTSNWCAKMN